MSPFSPNPGSYLSEDTIAALASAPGGAITILRISGPQAFSALRSLLGTSRGTAAQVAERVLFRAGLRDSKGLPLDEALAVRFQAPRSFTGEDIVELYLHGSTFIASRVMEVLADFGIRQALPGEFSFRAVRNGKLTLGQAQSVADLISATNDSAVRLALEKLSGSQNRLLKIIADDLRNVAVLAETAIDFSDQEDCSSSLMGLSLESLKKKVLPVLETLEKLQSSYARGLRIQEGVRAAFIGLPNAGKSSFFNALLGEDRSIVSELAGTTRDVVHEQMCLRGHRGTVTLRLEDTAGLRSSEHPVERMGIERTLRSARDADLIFLIVDGRACLTHGIDSVQDQWRAIGSPKEKTLGILSKISKLLNDNGYVYITVPNTMNPDESLDRFFHFEHCYYFTPLTLKKMLLQNGFKIIWMSMLPREIKIIAAKTNNLKQEIDSGKFELLYSPERVLSAIKKQDKKYKVLRFFKNMFEKIFPEKLQAGFKKISIKIFKKIKIIEV